MHTDTPHKPRFQLWAALIAGMIALPASAADVDYAPLVPYEARYTASMSKGVSLNGEGVRELTDQGNNVWLYRTDVDSFIADINESLIFRWEDGQVIPLRYRYHLSGFLIKDRKQSIDFDWQAGTATGSYRGEKFEVELRD
ncbi:MAG: DUF3108 domain-containing protein, partial [Pseudomonadota bacterium]|nr:DUF3108 domain-containing protein [Pseudomonadota bacterium]